MTRSRLSSITQQQNELQTQIRTQQALLLVYYQLYIINYVKIIDDPYHHFQNISQCLQKQNNVSNLFKWEKFDQWTISERNKIQLNLLDNIKNQFQKQQSISSVKELTIHDIIQQLHLCDGQRTQIKYQIYLQQQHGRVDKLYEKWIELNKKMKQLLQLYLNKLSNGKSLYQLYSSLPTIRTSKKIIQGYPQKQLMNKLDIYLQSMFSDQHQLQLYKNSFTQPKNMKLSATTVSSPIKKQKNNN